MASDVSTTFVTLSEQQDGDLYYEGKVTYERVEAALNHEVCVLTKLSSETPPQVLTLTVDELDKLLVARTASIQQQETPSPLASPASDDLDRLDDDLDEHPF